jgi:hypothetical protein
MPERDVAPHADDQPPVRPTATKEVPPNPRLIRGRQLVAIHNLAEEQRRREAVATSLSAEGLQTILKALRDFEQGVPLRPKTRKLLEEILLEDMRRKCARKAARSMG